MSTIAEKFRVAWIAEQVAQSARGLTSLWRLFFVGAGTVAAVFTGKKAYDWYKARQAANAVEAQRRAITYEPET